MTASTPTSPAPHHEYGGFWIRAAAVLVDGALLALITIPFMLLVYGDQFFRNDGALLGFWDFVVTWVLPVVVTLAFWVRRGATPGKLALGLEVVDIGTGERPTLRQAVIRYLGYLLSTLPLGLGYIWIALDPRRRGWHDMLAGTVVIRHHPAHRKAFVDPVPLDRREPTR